MKHNKNNTPAKFGPNPMCEEQWQSCCISVSGAVLRAGDITMMLVLKTQCVGLSQKQSPNSSVPSELVIICQYCKLNMNNNHSSLSIIL